ncbi:hypothetical protein GCM10007989_13240 [Devosia pacifica]|uniref:AAA+ ATPase domain-containing protein n=1 Tax=Devosia pacifica TaxID=1335967 RepID=A0A918S2X9_9HYPH|nr:AAA family ATPase [Devosia pacifica]GHA19115.1 hypothetical protein GCM10007989_13240 [Devosia pacifica]
MFESLNTANEDPSDRPRAAIALPVAIAQHALGKDILGVIDDPRLPAMALIIKVPSDSWCDPLERALDRMLKTVEVHSYKRGRRSSSRKDEFDLLGSLGSGLSTIAISATPEDTIGTEYHAVADRVIEITKLDVKVVRKVIRQVTGGSSGKLTQADLVGIGLHEAVAAIGAGGSATDCIARLARIRARKSAPADLSHIATLEALPLVAPVRDWADKLAADLARVDTGQLPQSALRFSTMEGPPGTGKTVLAASIAKSSGWTFHRTSIQDWFNAGDGHLGAVTKACAEFIDRLLSEDRAIGFIDELQSIPNRGALDARGRDWWMPVVDGILVQIDRVRQSGKKILLLGACNHYDMLDPALIRPGRLETRVSVLPPSTVEEAVSVLRFYLGDRFSLGEIETVGNLAIGASPAFIESTVRQAEGIARQHERDMTVLDLVSIFAPEETKDAEDTLHLALHEAAHAVIAYRLGVGVTSVTIVQLASKAGVTVTESASGNPLREDIENLITIGLAGRAADELLGKGPDAGSAHDLAAATSLLVSARESWGLYGKLSVTSQIPSANAASRADLHEWVENQLSRLMQRAREMVTENEMAIRALASELVKRRVLRGAAITETIESATTSAHAQRDEPAVVELGLLPKRPSTVDTGGGLPTSRP